MTDKSCAYCERCNVDDLTLKDKTVIEVGYCYEFCCFLNEEELKEERNCFQEVF